MAREKTVQPAEGKATANGTHIVEFPSRGEMPDWIAGEICRFDLHLRGQEAEEFRQLHADLIAARATYVYQRPNSDTCETRFVNTKYDVLRWLLSQARR